MLLELPHTGGCLVCGRDNPHGMRLHLNVDDQSGVVSCDFTPAAHHIGFSGIIHGGVLATVLDEAMVWAAIWSEKRFCVCGELNVRFRHSAAVGQSLHVQAQVAAVHSRLLETKGSITDSSSGKVLVRSTGKYVPLPDDRNRGFLASLVVEPATAEAVRAFKSG